MKKVGFIDIVHSVLHDELTLLGFECTDLTSSSKQEIAKALPLYCGLVVRSRFPLDKDFLQQGVNLEFIARSGAGLENIDVEYCRDSSIELFNAPEGNRNAVGEHALGMLLSLFNNLYKCNFEVKTGEWFRESNRGVELDGKVVGIIGYGNNGSKFAEKLRGFDVEILAYDKFKSNFGDSFVKEVELDSIFRNADILSLHIPENCETRYLVQSNFINKFSKSFYLLNMARGSIISTEDLVEALQSGKVLGACLDVLEYEKSSFENLFSSVKKMPDSFKYLIQAPNVLLSPHVAGWTHESYYKLSTVLVEKIKKHYQL